MKAGISIVLGAVVISAALISCKKSEAPASGGQPAAATAAKPQVYAVVGTVKGFREDNKIVVLAHEAIPGLMDAMTMGFELADPALAKGLKVGDKVDGTLEVGEASFKITAMKKTGK